MTKDHIICLPNKHLRQKSEIVKAITPKINEIIEDMIAATISWDDSREHEVGVALAAVQIDQLQRIIIIREDHEDKNNLNFLVFINPRVTKLYGDIVEDFEGCLSVPNVYGKVPRFDRVNVKALDRDGHEFEVKSKGFIARIFQHEIDHTEGIVFIDKIKEREDAFFVLSQKGKLEQLNYEDEIKKNPILWK